MENGRQTQAVGHGVLCERCGSPLQDRSPRCCDRMGAGPHPHVDPVRRWRGKAKAQGGFQQRRVVEDWKGQTYIRNRRDQTGVEVSMAPQWWQDKCVGSDQSGGEKEW